jgi:hypothetical protein
VDGTATIRDDAATTSYYSTDVASNVVTHTSNGTGAFAQEVWKLNDGGTPSERMRLTTTGLGIGTSSPSATLNLSGGGNAIVRLENNSSSLTTNSLLGSTQFYSNDPSGLGAGVKASVNAYSENSTGSAYYMTFNTTSFSGSNDTERMRIDSSGNLLVGTTNTNIVASSTATDEGFVYVNGSALTAARSAGHVADFNRITNDGEIIRFRKNGSTGGSIVAYSGSASYTGSSYGIFFNNHIIAPVNSTGISRVDNLMDIGQSAYRFDDIYATNGTIQTSDRNEKQDIAELTDAEQRVAVAAKGLMRKFRWRDAVEAKGDDARTHFGIIAQDLQAAFAAEGLDAGGYAMFISTTWWETQTEVPAVDAVAEVLDEEGNVVTEAVEAVDAYTRTDAYDTQEEAPEGATERTRLGVRYSELLAFIIGAI